jgi:hypothetical protein
MAIELHLKEYTGNSYYNIFVVINQLYIVVDLSGEVVYNKRQFHTCWWVVLCGL